MAKDLKAGSGELEDELKRCDQRISELRDEIDEQRELINRLRDNVEDYDQVTESWCETFDMVQTEKGGWTWAPFWDAHNDLVRAYNDLVRRWNRALPWKERAYMEDKGIRLAMEAAGVRSPSGSRLSQSWAGRVSRRIESFRSRC